MVWWLRLKFWVWDPSSPSMVDGCSASLYCFGDAVQVITIHHRGRSLAVESRGPSNRV